MPAISLADAEAKLTAWMAADSAVASGQAYSIGGRSFTRADARTIRENIDYWNQKISELSSGSRGGARVRYGVPS